MQNFSTDAAGFAGLTLAELILQHLVLRGLMTPGEARRLLDIAARRHEAAAVGSEEKIALNMEAAHLLRALSLGLEPLFTAKTTPPEDGPSAHGANGAGARAASPCTETPREAGPRRAERGASLSSLSIGEPRDLWLRFPP